MRALLKHPFVLLPWPFYLATMSPTIGMGDTALLLGAMERLRLSSWVNSHNLTILAGWLLRQLHLTSLAVTGNMVSALFGAATVVVFYLAVHDAMRSRIAAALAASALAVSHSLWWHSTIAEVYALNGLLTVTALWLLCRLDRGGGRRTLYGLFFVAGLAIFNHVQLGILGVAGAVTLAWRMVDDARAGRLGKALREFGACAAWCALGLLPYLYFLVRDIVEGDGTYGVGDAVGGGWGEIMFAGSAAEGVGDVAFLLLQQFPSPFLVAIVVGVGLLIARPRSERGPGPRVLAGLAAAWLLNTSYFAVFPTWDKFAYLLPSFLLLAYAGAFALAELMARLRGAAAPVVALLLAVSFVVPPPWIYAQSGRWAATDGVLRRRYNPEPLQNLIDMGEYLGNPDKRGFDDVETFTGLLFEALPVGATYVDDDARTYHVLKHLQRTHGQRADVALEQVPVWQFIDWGLSKREFFELVADAYHENQTLFLASLEEPYSRLLASKALEGVRFRRFDLGDGGARWIYKLVTADASPQELALIQPLPEVLHLRLGVTLEGVGQGLGSYRRGSSVAALARFGINEQPLPMRFQWVAPSGRISRRADLANLPVGTRHGLQDELPAADEVGSWRVQVLCRGSILAERAFEVLAP